MDLEEWKTLDGRSGFSHPQTKPEEAASLFVGRPFQAVVATKHG